MSRPAVAAELLRAHTRTLKMPGLARSFEARDGAAARLRV